MRLLKEIRTLMGNYHVKSGIYHYYRNEFKQAAEFFRKALRDGPTITDADRRTARYYLTMTFMTSAEHREKNDDLEAAAGDYHRASEVRPDYPDIRFRLGRTLERLERFDEAIEQYRQAAGRRDYLDAQVALAFCLLHRGRNEEAAAAMQRALELKVRKIEAPFRQGLEKLRAGESGEAADWFREAFLSEPHRFEESFGAALEHLKAEQYEQALRNLDLAVELNPRYPDLHNYRGIALCELGRVPDGIEAFRKAAAMKPDFLVPWLNLAFAQLRAGRLKEAEHELEAILRRDPTERAAAAKLEELQTGRVPERRRSPARGAS